MAWEIKDEYIDLAAARHVVVFHNRDAPVRDGVTGIPVPVEHHLINEFKLDACPHCGVAKTEPGGSAVDFAKVKTETLAKLQAHHGQMMKYRELHPKVRLGNGPK